MSLLDFFLLRPDGRAGAMKQPSPPPASPARNGPKAGTLAFVVGISAAGMLLQAIPAEESGRKVEVDVAADGTATVRHLSGRQYLRVYLDIAGVPTACDGLTRRDVVRLGRTFTEAQCAALLEQELIRHAAPVMRCIPRLAADKDRMAFQIVAVVSHAYNFGPAATCGSSIARNINAGRIEAGCEALLPWNKARVNGVLRPVTGLTRRRNRERQYCLTNIHAGYTPANLAARMRPWR